MRKQRNQQKQHTGQGGNGGWERDRFGGKDYVQPRFGSYYGSELGQHRGYRDHGDRQRARMGSTPRGYTRSDERIREDVCDALMLNGEFEGCDIEVQVKDGEVTLSGTVPERRLKLLVEELSDSVLGVKDVTNSLRVRSDQERDEPSTPPAGSRTASGNAGERMPNASRA